jgi:transposase InsO family protein
MDLAGPSAEASIDGGRYVLMIVDDYSQYYHIDILKSKDEAFGRIREFVLQWKKQLDLPVKTIRSDKGGEFVHHCVRDFLKEKGLVQELTTPYTPEQNGVAERSFRTIKEGTQTLLLQANLKPKYWALAAKTFVYTRSKTLSTSLKDGTPEERFTGDVPDVSDLRVYGCVAYAHKPKSQRDTWSPTAKRCVFVGYGQEQGLRGGYFTTLIPGRKL